MNYVAIAGRLIRLLRGKRSQTALSRWLGYKSNVIYSWEKGLKHPRADDAFRLARKVGVDLQEVIDVFWTHRTCDRATSNENDLSTEEGIRQFLSSVRGNSAITDLAERTGFSRFAISRWMSGQTAPKLHQFLALIDASSGRLVDFVSAFAAIDDFPELKDRARQIDLQRRIARDMPKTQAVLLGLETLYSNDNDLDSNHLGAGGHGPECIEDDTTDWKIHTVDALTQTLAFSREEILQALTLLEDSGMIRPDETRKAYALQSRQIIDTTSMPEAADAMRHWVHQEADKRRGAGNPGLFAYNVFSVSNETLSQLQDLQFAYFQQMRSLIALDKHETRVVVANLQLFALDNKPLS